MRESERYYDGINTNDTKRLMNIDGSRVERGSLFTLYLLWRFNPACWQHPAAPLQVLLGAYVCGPVCRELIPESRMPRHPTCQCPSSPCIVSKQTVFFSVMRPYAFSALTHLLCPSSESSVIKLRRNSLEHESIS